MPRRDDAPRDLLFGLLALQNGMITRDQLVAAFGVWTGASDRTMAEILVGQAALTLSRRALLDALAAEHLAAHGGDPEASLASLELGSSIRDSLVRAGGEDLEPSLATVGTARRGEGGNAKPDDDAADEAHWRRVGDAFASVLGRDPADRSAYLARACGDDDALRQDVERLLDAATRSSSEGFPNGPVGVGDRTDLDLSKTRTFVADGLPADASHRFRILRRHARGGLGVVYVALDSELNREVALKQILDDQADDSSSRRRFLLEAEITGGLEHPGIVPVYSLGTDADGRPYYAMRFIKGDSLKDAINTFHANKSTKGGPGARALALQKLLRRFLDVCNAVAYAHSRGILHRDLKPANVMVGKYGETLVVDWGLAKVVGRSGEDGPGSLPEATLLSPSSDTQETMPGSRIGTPGYMSPEQAAGRLDLLGPASDVYSLGATLYNLLTGQRAIAGGDLPENYRKIEQGDFSRPRESAPWLDPALEAVCLKAMALRPLDRYPSPRFLAEDIERWLADEPVNAYREPLARRARRWIRKHRTAVATVAASAAVAAILLGVYAWQRIDRRQKTDESALATLGQAEGLAIGARASRQPGDWEKTIAEARIAKDRLDSGNGSPALRRDVTARLLGFQAEKSQLEQAIEADRRDHQVVADLEEARLRMANVKDERLGVPEMHAAYEAAFRGYGIDVEALAVEEAARRIRSSKIREQLLSALDEWSMARTRNVPRERLLAIARASETDSVRKSIREAVVRRDAAALRRLCEKAEDRRHLGPRLRSVFEGLLRLDPAGSFPQLETIRGEDPSDLWLNHDLGMAYSRAKPPRFPEALRCLWVALALRPDSPGVHGNFASVLFDMGDLDGAIVAFRKVVELAPKAAQGHANLGVALRVKGDVEGALVELRKAIDLDSTYAPAHAGIGAALEVKGDHDGAIVEYRKAIEIDPENAVARSNLGFTLEVKGDHDGAIVEYRKAIEIDPENAMARCNLGGSLHAKGDFDGALVELRKSIELDPNLAKAHANLGIVLNAKLDPNAALVELRKAIELDPKTAEAHRELGAILSARLDFDGAIVEFRKVIELEAKNAKTHYNLGTILAAKGDLDGAIVEFREAIDLDPNIAEMHCNLGQVLKQRGLYAEALRSLEKGHELGSKQPNWSYPSAKWVSECRRLIELERTLPALLNGDVTPKDVNERIELALLCYTKTLYAASARFYGQAFANRPVLAANLMAGHRYNAACSAGRAGSGQGRDDPPPDDRARAVLREQARVWLQADLLAWKRVLEGAPLAAPKVVETLDHWKKDADLAGIRDEAALAKLPEGEREAFRSLWADVEALRKKAGGS